ncbi:MAG: VanW family protein [Candidatus Doudnabacteria bacterium]
MSALKSAKLIFISLLLFLPAVLAHAKTLTFQDKHWEVPADQAQLVNQGFVRNDFDLPDVAQAALFGNAVKQSTRLLDETSVNDIEQIEQEVDQQAHQAVLEITDSVATKFDPGQNGQVIDLYALRALLTSDMILIDLPVVETSGKGSLADTNDLGIKELVATGESNFAGSPSNRIHNIKVGADKFNGLIISPGQEFSFDKYLGDVDDVHGFLPELVIKPEGVLPEFGGGLCQVSTTTFRAAMNAGLPVTARRNHSFAVQYYAPQGTDATIYPGSADLKFVNNLPSSLLIRTRVEGKKLYFDFFGTKDDRVVAFDGPTVYDKKPDGSMKADWTRHVTLNGQTTNQTFKSTYLPPALFTMILSLLPQRQIRK